MKVDLSRKTKMKQCLGRDMTGHFWDWITYLNADHPKNDFHANSKSMSLTILCNEDPVNLILLNDEGMVFRC